MRTSFVRRCWQVAFTAIFFFLTFHTAAGLKGLLTLPMSGSAFLEADPLIALGCLLSTGQLYPVAGWGLLALLAVFVGTLLFGRVFCGWVCPFGATHHLLGWLFKPKRSKDRIARNAFQPASGFKYVLLAAFCGAACLGSLQVGLLDPISLYHRSVAACLFPLVEHGLRSIMPEGFAWIYPGHIPLHAWGWIIGSVVLALFLANLAVPRFFCRYLCPLGGLLGLLSRFSLFRIARDGKACVNCGLCVQHCEGACEPDRAIRRSECLACFNCFDDCPHGALSYGFLPTEDGEVSWPAVRGRRMAMGAMAGVVLAPMARLSGRTTRGYSGAVIRPPGSVEELEFLKRCVKCGQCIRVCPSNVLQPALLEAGVEGLWTPILKMRFGACDKDCTLCSQVCPTGAMMRILPAQRNGHAPYPGGSEPVQVKLGTAFYDRGRCLPWAMDKPCVVCEEVCPVSPKAIQARAVMITRHDGTKVSLKRPQVEPDRCIGCGACQHACVVKDLPAIRVSAIGESRSRGWGGRDRALLLDG